MELTREEIRHCHELANTMAEILMNFPDELMNADEGYDLEVLEEMTDTVRNVGRRGELELDNKVSPIEQARMTIGPSNRTFTLYNQEYTEVDDDTVLETNTSDFVGTYYFLYKCQGKDSLNVYLVTSKGPMEAVTEKKGPMHRKEGQKLYDYLKKEWSKPSAFRTEFPVER